MLCYRSKKSGLARTEQNQRWKFSGLGWACACADGAACTVLARSPIIDPTHPRFQRKGGALYRLSPPPPFILYNPRTLQSKTVVSSTKNNKKHPNWNRIACMDIPRFCHFAPVGLWVSFEPIPAPRQLGLTHFGSESFCIHVPNCGCEVCFSRQELQCITTAKCFASWSLSRVLRDSWTPFLSTEASLENAPITTRSESYMFIQSNPSDRISLVSATC